MRRHRGVRDEAAFGDTHTIGEAGLKHRIHVGDCRSGRKGQQE
jgi:hypothetical protein